MQGKTTTEQDARREAELRERELQAATGRVPPALVAKLADSPERRPGAWVRPPFGRGCEVQHRRSSTGGPLLTVR